MQSVDAIFDLLLFSFLNELSNSLADDLGLFLSIKFKRWLSVLREITIFFFSTILALVVIYLKILQAERNLYNKNLRRIGYFFSFSKLQTEKS